MATISSKDIPPEVADEVLRFLNDAQKPEHIAGKEPQFGPVYDDPDAGDRDGYDIGIEVATRLLAKRNRLGGFTRLEQLSGIRGFGRDKFADLVYTAVQPAVEFVNTSRGGDKVVVGVDKDLGIKGGTKTLGIKLTNAGADDKVKLSIKAKEGKGSAVFQSSKKAELELAAKDFKDGVAQVTIMGGDLSNKARNMVISVEITGKQKDTKFEFTVFGVELKGFDSGKFEDVIPAGPKVRGGKGAAEAGDPDTLLEDLKARHDTGKLGVVAVRDKETIRVGLYFQGKIIPTDTKNGTFADDFAKGREKGGFLGDRKKSIRYYRGDKLFEVPSDDTSEFFFAHKVGDNNEYTSDELPDKDLASTNDFHLYVHTIDTVSRLEEDIQKGQSLRLRSNFEEFFQYGGVVASNRVGWTVAFSAKKEATSDDLLLDETYKDAGDDKAVVGKAAINLTHDLKKPVGTCLL